MLGPLEIVDGERRLPLGGAKRRAVIALLLLDANRVVSSERLIDAVWGADPPAAALPSLQNHVLRLRRELGDRIITRPPGYLLRVERDELDLERFRQLAEESRGGEPREAAALLRRALALWRGPPLADLAREPVAAAAAGLDELRLEALERRIDADLALGRHAELVSELEALAAEHPFRERLRAQLVLALYRSGRQADALDAYAAARGTLVDQLGAEPGPELQELQRAILRHDAALGAPAPPPPTEEEAAAEIEEARKTVTVLLADLREDARADPEARREEVQRAHAAATAALAAHGGSVGQEGGADRLLAIFGVPFAHEDDALRAVQAACDLRAAGLVARVALATGDVITGDPSRGRPLVSGLPLQAADRLLAAAREGEVLAGERTWRLVRHGVVGVAEADRAGAYSLERVHTGAEAVVRLLETPLVGRADELGELLAAFRRARRDGRARLVTVFGSPGVGKTRLARELVDTLCGSATCAVGRMPSYGDASTYAPLRDAFSTLAHGSVGTWARGVLAGEADADPVAVRIAASVGETASRGPVEETAWAVRRLLETLAQDTPVLLVLDDLHDASPAFLDLVEHVATLARAPILLLVLARPELLDTRPDWGGGGVGAASILLDALPAEDAGDLLDRLAATTPLAPERREAILAAAAGNPLFLEQMLAAGLEDGETAVPDSIHALLAARLDRLGEDERHVLQAAAVYGQTFPTELVQSLLDVDVRNALLALVRRDLVEPDATDPLGREAWAFRHALVRDEAYASVPKRRRAGLHERIALLVATHAERQGVDAAELIGSHLESAYRAAYDVDPQAPELARLAAGAAQHLAAAGRRALDERDMATAAALLARAVELLPPTAPDRVDLAFRLADALCWIDEREAALRVLDEAEPSRDPADARAHARLLVARHGARLWGLEPEDPARVLTDVRRALATLEEAGDHEGAAFAHIVICQLTDRVPTALDPERELTLAVEHAHAAGDRALEGFATSWLCVHLRRGQLPVDEARQRILRILEDPPTELARASALGGLADLHAMEGAFDEARALVAENHAIIDELGLPQTAAADLIAVADVEIAAGDLGAAERVLREAIDRLGALGDRFSAANAAWRLALVLVQQGRDEEARPLVAQAGAPDARGFVRLWHLLLDATLAARHGRRGRAATLLEQGDRELERIMESIPERGMHVDWHRQAAEVSELLGRHDEAAARLRRAAALAERLGYVVGAQAATERLAEIEARR